MSSCKHPNLLLALMIFALAFTVRLAIMLVARPYEQPLRTEIHRLAVSIASGKGYGNPWATPTGPTAVYSPGCPFVLAGVYRVFGNGIAAEGTAYVLNILAVSLICALLPVVSGYLGLPKTAGVLAGTAGALIPVYLLNEFRSITAVSGALCMVFVTLMTAYVWKSGRALTGRLGGLFGAAWGIALLVSPNLLTLCFAWLLIAAYVYRRRMIRFTLTFALAAFTIMLPWALRNAFVRGSPIFLRSNFGLELQIANNDLAGPSYAANSVSFARYHPFVNPEESARVHDLGEAAYMRQKLDQAVEWIQRHPSRFASLTGIQICQFWLPKTYRFFQTVILFALTLAAAAGLALAWKQHRPAFWVLGSVWFAYPLVYYVVQLDNPYRYPMYWTVLLLAAYTSTEAIRRWTTWFDVERP